MDKKRFSFKIIYGLLGIAFLGLSGLTVGVFYVESERQEAAVEILRDENIRHALSELDDEIASFLSAEESHLFSSLSIRLPRHLESQMRYEGQNPSAHVKNPAIRQYLWLNNQGLILPVREWKEAQTHFLNIHGALDKGNITIEQQTPFLPHWRGADLVFLKQIYRGDQFSNFVIWLDWDQYKKVLLEKVSDVFPQAELVARREGELQTENKYPLSSLPAWLVVDRDAGIIGEPAMSTQLFWVLLIIWVLMIATAWGLILFLKGFVRLGERRSRFVSAVTHELRTPISTISLYAEMLEQNMVGEKKKTSYYQVLQTEAKRLSHLIENILTYARLEKKVVQPYIEYGEIGSLLAPMVEKFTLRCEDVGVTFSMRYDESVLGREVGIDTVVLEQILSNLLDNALKYGEVRPLWIDLSVYYHAHEFMYCFRDNGVGVDPSMMDYLFEPFQRSADASAGKKSGVGLGLALSRELARMQKGELTLNKQYVEGAEFVLKLPDLRQK